MNNIAFFQEQDDAFKQFVVLSLLLHLILLITITLKNIFVSGEVIELQRSVRVDLVALPDKVPEELAQPTKSKEKSKLVDLKPKSEEKKGSLKEIQKKALEKLQALSALEKIKNEVRENSRRSKSVEAAPEKFQFKGNIISSGSDFTGLSRLRVNEYLENLKAKVHEHWILPQWLNDVSLKAEIIIVIDQRGYVIKKDVRTPSGNSVFDESCLVAVVDAAPFSSPPEEVRDNQILIRFPD